MKTTSLAGFALTLAAAAFTLPAHATQMTIDGNFADWGVANNGTVSGWTPGSGILFTVDDRAMPTTATSTPVGAARPMMRKPCT
ncbi:MAG: hypothetical protein IPJ73_12685 [Zoogloea sp.]|nr:hypothetical protein [Zoogloea sp.]